MNIRDYVQLNYDKIKNILRSEYIKFGFETPFDEDIFHDTLMKSIYSLDDKEIDDTIINYFITSFKMNCIRETQYSRVKYRTEMEDMNNLDGFIEELISNIDIEKTIKALILNFGKKYTICFILWCKGWQISEIQNHFGIFNLYYKFNLIKKYIKQYCI